MTGSWKVHAGELHYWVSLHCAQLFMKVKSFNFRSVQVKFYEVSACWLFPGFYHCYKAVTIVGMLLQGKGERRRGDVVLVQWCTRNWMMLKQTLFNWEGLSLAVQLWDCKGKKEINLNLHCFW